jgi:hypothetical protein
MNRVNVAREFTRYPSGRYRRNGTTSGEEFRQRFLEGPLVRGESVVVELDGTIGYGSSFLEEAFGGLCRTTDVAADAILERISLDTSDDQLKAEIRQYILEAASGRP